MSTSEISPVTLELWVDPICPWAWMTSRWLAEVEQVRPVTVTYRVMSLAYLNRDREMPPEYDLVKTEGWKPVRVLAAVGQERGSTAVRNLYEQMGQRLHPGGRELKEIDAIIDEALVEVGLPSTFIAAATDPTFDDLVIREHHAGMDQVGTDVGTPVIAVGGAAIFGPVVTPAPKGEAAGRLFDGVMLVMQTPGFYELKRSRTTGPQFD
jgi:hypothetical protein